MSFDLGNLLQGKLGGILGQYLTSNGENAENSMKAAGVTLPAVVAGLVKHVGDNPANAAGLFDLIKGATGSQLSGAVEQAGEGRGLEGLAEWGKRLLPDLLGGNAADVADQISQESGVSKASAGSLLSLALPLVLSVLRGKVQDDDMTQGQLLGLLGQQQSWLSKVLSGGMLSALGIGSLSGLFGNLSHLAGGLGGVGAGAAGAAAATAAGKGSGLGKWIALALAALLALFAFKSCGGKEEPAQMPTTEMSASAASDGAESMATASAEVEAASPVMPSEPVEASMPAVAPAASEAEASAPEAVKVETADVARVTYEDGVAKFYFATAKSDVAEGAEAIVADVIAAGKEGKKLVISGFADSTGNAKANQQLSKKRAESVKAFFEAQGVEAKNIELRKPESTTGAIGNDVEGRRVEVKVEG
ncbi:MULTISPECIES: OmpA family protein [unclassified Neisseria]|uniref:OmpA family protein n=1 Tax=unclassified Neisseria TaxID=2623750 RepID=UPI0026662387|nr:MULTISPECIES: OmpA family protein [unclassified Neisseria]MDO1510380.1 OmpA family protein [Neisseria sp. MVDL19-042950]MDO1516549.1 OmpA family protein [Neisseria sp. MVDL18-041461]MDO1563658.1 OmpA family protein [Neisseria sp. MVDL20-010259]